VIAAVHFRFLFGGVSNILRTTFWRFFFKFDRDGVRLTVITFLLLGRLVLRLLFKVMLSRFGWLAFEKFLLLFVIHCWIYLFAHF
jgi:hypothetical protein